MIGTVEGLKGEFRKADLDSAVTVQIGDQATIIGNQIVITRGGVVVATRTIAGPHESVPLGAEQSESINHILYFWRPPVEGVVVTLVNVIKNTSTGSITFVFSNGSVREFADQAQAVSETQYIGTDPKFNEDLLIRKTNYNSPTGVNLTTMVGASCSVDIAANVPVVLTVE